MKMSPVCLQLVVVAVTLSLGNVACQTVHDINISDEVHSGRQRRQVRKLSQQQSSEIVRRHNVLRAREGASNMETLVWKPSIANLQAASTTVLGSSWMPGGCATDAQMRQSGDSQYTFIGQNFFYTTASTLNVAQAIDAWYSEKVHYDYDSGTYCSGRECLNYTLMIWATTTHIGCAYRQCPTSSNYIGCAEHEHCPAPSSPIMATPVYYLQCNYWRTMYPAKIKPYIKGPACSNCSGGVGWCKGGLCNINCSSPGDGCSCGAICRNGGTLDSEHCACLCAIGWHGSDCSLRCVDSKYCNSSSAWSPKHCHESELLELCPGMCELCIPDPAYVAGEDEIKRGGGGTGDENEGIHIKPAATTTFLMVIIAAVISIAVMK